MAFATNGTCSQSDFLLISFVRKCDGICIPFRFKNEINFEIRRDIKKHLQMHPTVLCAINCKCTCILERFHTLYGCSPKIFNLPEVTSRLISKLEGVYLPWLALFIVMGSNLYNHQLLFPIPNIPLHTFVIPFNPPGITGLLTPFLICSYHEMFTCSANYGKSLKMLHHKRTCETVFLHPL